MYHSILVAVDGSPFAERALPFAEAITRASNAKLVIVQVVPEAGPNATDEDVAIQADQIVQAQTHVNDLAGRIDPRVVVETAVTVGDPPNGILEEAKERAADVIVLSTHGRSGLGRWIYGSVADEVMRHSPIPVLLVPSHAHFAWPKDRAPRVLVPLDGSHLATGAIRAADELAESIGGNLLFVQAVEPHPPMYGDPSTFVVIDPTVELEAAKSHLEKVAADLRGKGRTVEIADVLGLAVTSIIDVARERGVDVIAMSTHGSGGLTRLVMGSIATGIIQRADVPVFIVRPAESSSPS